MPAAIEQADALAAAKAEPAVAAAIDAGQAENLPVNYLEGVAAQLDG